MVPHSNGNELYGALGRGQWETDMSSNNKAVAECVAQTAGMALQLTSARPRDYVWSRD